MNRRLIFAAGGLVAFAAAAATAHGMYETAVAAGVDQYMAITYPIMFDGQALVAYAATTRLRGGGRWYAWTVVILSAALSGLAQASYLGTGKQLHAPAELAFGIGYWPAIAWTVTAHLLYLLHVSNAGGEELGSDKKVPTSDPVSTLRLDTAREADPAPAPATTPIPKPERHAAATAGKSNEEIEAALRALVDAGQDLPSNAALRRAHPGMGPDRARKRLEVAEEYARNRPTPIRLAQ